MKAVGYRSSLPITDHDSLLDVTLPDPDVGEHDVLVRVSAVSVNPVDAKMRMRSQPAPGEIKVLGWDAVGVVEQTGGRASKLKIGDRVYYAGSIARTGTNAELHAVDERVVGHAPKSIDDGHAAAIPLTAITAWELLFDRLRVVRHQGAGQRLLIVGGAGGVGSMLIQLARQLTALTVIATASREESRRWCMALGAHAVIDHGKPLSGELKAQSLGHMDYVASLTHTDLHFDEIVECLKPQGALALIDDPKPIDVMKLKRKSLSLHWELMFTRSLFDTPDIAAQGALLDEVAALIDQGTLKTTANQSLGLINATNLKRAHAMIESNSAIGKIVLSGF
jgi:zinc-binding alcohol dehydrogenase family protein